ncbi:MAG: hypothetical protein RUMPE_00021 [Eubacteriales bacterium SKADARSKE-1]|nr:hypothetical protein [Eubacteriales bacterium SKADARSKE-1]
MNYLLTKNNITVENSFKINLENTFNCGQCFRWNRLFDGSFVGVAFGKVLSIKTDENKLVFKKTTMNDFENIWADYFDLNLNYDLIEREIAKIDSHLKTVTLFSPGIRILKQDSWEALCSFIISQNNNIPRIKGIIERLCQSFGEKIEDSFFSFPTAQTIAELNENDLAPLRCGFRSSYIIDAAKKVASGEINLQKIKTLPLNIARSELMKIKGVGPKVAECTLLYGMHRLDAFPIDVWMKKAMQNIFPEKSPADFGKYAGIAQQYIFHYARMTKLKEF